MFQNVCKVEQLKLFKNLCKILKFLYDSKIFVRSKMFLSSQTFFGSKSFVKLINILKFTKLMSKELKFSVLYIIDGAKGCILTW
jgi:hypothetical protein